MPTIEVKVPAIGDYKDVPVIDVLVKPGDDVKADDPLVTLESDKATMDVPAPAAGKVRELKVKTGDRVSEGSIVLTLEAGAGAKPAAADGGGAAQAARAETSGEAAEASAGPPTLTRTGTRTPTAPPASRAPAPPPSPRPAPASRGGEPAERRPTSTSAIASALEVKVPSIGDYTDVPIIDVLVKAGDEVAADAPLVTLESDKATMDVPSPAAGKIRELKVKTGDRVSEGSVIAILESAPPATHSDLAASALEPVEGRDHVPEQREPAAPAAAPQPAAPALRAVPPPRPEEPQPAGRVAHASPSVRKLARELGVDLSRVEGSGPKGRVLQPDVQRYVKEALARAAAAPAAGVGAGGLELAPWPKVDFAKFGPVEVQPLSRIRKLSKTNLARNWVMIPHVTQHDEADITELEKFRKELNDEHAKQGLKVTLLAFLVKAAVAALREFPELNASLDGDQLVLKHYFHVGFAADTPHGLVVPVIHDADLKGVLEIAKELGALAAKAREGKLALADMQGGCFSISSLGGIGGTFFTPIINAPEVAILGVSRSAMKPVWDGEKFVPRLILPLSLSYDHRVIDGALAARITSFLVRLLGDFRRAML